MVDKKIPHPPEYGVPDEDNPEWTAADFRRARPVKDVFPELIEAAKRARGRPRAENPKIQVTLRLDPEVVRAFKAGGAGWQRRINDALLRVVRRKKRAA
jgi:uncharacterized protein (DUF4415 family)